MNNRTYLLYTDGGAVGNPGPGGYGVVIVDCDGKKIELSEGFAHTTNNRMELLGAIRALEFIPEGSSAILTSDSKYLVEAINQKWLPGWKKRGWKRSAGPLVNADLWKKLDELLSSRKVDFTWTKGHANHALNERCDVLAGIAMRQPNLPEDKGYKTDGSFVQQKLPQPAPAPIAVVSSNAKVDKENQPCRKCGIPVEKRISKKKERKPGQIYYYEWYLNCPNCGTNYMVEAAKRFYR